MSARQTPETPTLRDRATDAFDHSRERAVEAYDAAREKATEAKAKAKDGIDTNPLVALGGGLAIGALIAALLPKTKAEERLLGDAGRKITGTARDAAAAAKEAGREKLAELNITRDAGANAVQSLLNGLRDAAKSSGQAALGTVKKTD
ncbi:DUF883 family protein [Sphingomonas jaspsi]|uniref:DUF883 family protein n=1 Tax=Sphingomonas jaspsi TaxID=392409 RepID=UPI0004B891AE|nr:DUF883 family protein [Sphingomonas jaspsi]